MKEKASFLKHMDGTYSPSNHAAVEFDVKTKAGDEVFMVCTRSRSIKFHNRTFSMLHSFYDGTAISEQFPSFDAFREYLVIAAGFYESVEWPNGRIHLRSKSMAFSKMGSDEFDRLRDAMATVLVKLLANHPEEWVREEVMRF